MHLHDLQACAHAMDAVWSLGPRVPRPCTRPQWQSLWQLGGTPGPGGRQASGSWLGCSPLPPTQISHPRLPLRWPAALWEPARPMVLLPAWQLRCQDSQDCVKTGSLAEPVPSVTHTSSWQVQVCGAAAADSSCPLSSVSTPLLCAAHAACARKNAEYLQTLSCTSHVDLAPVTQPGCRSRSL